MRLTAIGIGASMSVVALMTTALLVTEPATPQTTVSANTVQSTQPTYKGRYDVTTPSPTPQPRATGRQKDSPVPAESSQPLPTSVAPKPTTVPPTTTVAPPPPPPVEIPNAPAPIEEDVPEDPVTPPEAVPAPAPAGNPHIPACHDRSLGVRPVAIEMCDQVMAANPGVTRLGGRAGRSRNSCHPSGMAVDFMVYGNRGLGDRIADYILANQRDLGVASVIWWQRRNSGSGWKQMEDRGSVTENHKDHVHASLAPCQY
jgi:hypothetical protein